MSVVERLYDKCFSVRVKVVVERLILFLYYFIIIHTLLHKTCCRRFIFCSCPFFSGDDSQ